MQVGQQNANIAAYSHSQLNVNAEKTGQQSIAAAKPNDATTASSAVQSSTIVTFSKEAQARADIDTLMEIGNGTGKPPLDP